MARYKEVTKHQIILIPFDLQSPFIPDSYKHILNIPIDNEIGSSRKTAPARLENIIYRATFNNTQSHCTTIADFIVAIEKGVIFLFLNVLLISYEQNLIGKDNFSLYG